MLDKYSKRNSSIELLRLFFMVMIVIIHAYGHGSGLDYDYLYSLGCDWSTAHHLGLLSLGKCGVTGFMFISGYYGIKLKWNKLAEMVAMLMFYLIVIACMGGYSVLGLFRQIVHPWDSWWFVSSYIVICVLAPFFNKGIEVLSKKQFGAIILALIFYEYVGSFLGQANSHDTVFLITVFLCARYTRLYVTPPPILRRKKTCLLIWAGLVMGAILFLCPIIFSRLGLMKFNSFFISNNNLLLLFFTASMVVVLDNRKWTNKIVNYLAASTLAIYLLTDNGMVRKPLDTWLLHEMLNGIHGYLYILIVAISCLLLDKVREAIFEIIKKITSKLNVNSIF